MSRDFCVVEARSYSRRGEYSYRRISSKLARESVAGCATACLSFMDEMKNSGSVALGSLFFTFSRVGSLTLCCSSSLLIYKVLYCAIGVVTTTERSGFNLV